MSISPIPVRFCTSFRRSTADETFANLYCGMNNALNLSPKKPHWGRTASYIIKLLISNIIPPHLTRASPPTSALATACRGEWQSGESPWDAGSPLPPGRWRWRGREPCRPPSSSGLPQTRGISPQKTQNAFKLRANIFHKNAIQRVFDVDHDDGLALEDGKLYPMVWMEHSLGVFAGYVRFVLPVLMKNLCMPNGIVLRQFCRPCVVFFNGNLACHVHRIHERNWEHWKYPIVEQ